MCWWWRMPLQMKLYLRYWIIWPCFCRLFMHQSYCAVTSTAPQRSFLDTPPMREERNLKTSSPSTTCLWGTPQSQPGIAGHSKESNTTSAAASSTRHTQQFSQDFTQPASPLGTSQSSGNVEGPSSFPSQQNFRLLGKKNKFETRKVGFWKIVQLIYDVHNSWNNLFFFLDFLYIVKLIVFLFKKPFLTDVLL